MNREQIQKEAVEAFLFQGGGRGTIVAGTGAGKSKMCIDIIQQIVEVNNKIPDILLLTNSQTLRDTNWKHEFEKWGLDWSTVTSETYQKMYKEKGEWDLIIYDEVDFACTEQYGKCFENLHSTYLLCLTGFLPPEKEEFLNKYAPVCYRAKTQDLQESGVLNKSEFILIYYPLSQVKNIEKLNKKKGTKFYTSENDEYKYWDKEFQKAVIVKNQTEQKAKLGLADAKAVNSADWNFKMKATVRKGLLNKLNSSVTVVKNLVSKIHETAGNKVLVFSALTEQADKFGFPTFHGKASSTEKDLESLNSGSINTLAVVKAVNRGVNLVGVNYIIREGFDSSEVDFQQIHGRLCRLPNNQTGKFIILIPTYEDWVKTESGSMKKITIKTQAQRWAEKQMKSFDITGIIRSITLDSTLQIKSGIEL